LQTLGQDFSSRFIDACLTLQQGEPIIYTLEDVAKLSERKALFPNSPVPPNITFKLVNSPPVLGDALKQLLLKFQLTWLPNEVGFFDAIYSSLFDRVQNIKCTYNERQVTQV
jgi:hypothetical protein